MDNRSSFGTPESAAPIGFGGIIPSTSELPVNRMHASFTVEGSGTVKSLTPLPRGVPILLTFIGSPTFVHSTKLLMPNGVNKRFAAGDRAWLRPDRDGVWRCIGIMPANPGPLFVFEGDSLTCVTNQGLWPLILPTVSGFFSRGTSLYYAADGESASTMVGQYTTQGGTVSFGSGIEAFYLLWAGTNDIVSGTSAATTYGYLTTIWAAARASGYKVVAFTIMSRNDNSGAAEIQRIELNRLIRSDASLYDYLVEPDLVFTNPLDMVLFNNTFVHLSAYGNNVLAHMVASKVLGTAPYESAPPEALAQNNIFINPKVAVNQTGAGGTLASGTRRWNADAWEAKYVHGAGTAVVIAQQLPSGSFPATLPGFDFAQQLAATTAVSSPANGDYALHRQQVEGYRVAHLGWGAKGALHLSYAFAFYTTVAGIIFVKVSNGARNRCFYQEQTVAAGWNFLTGSIPGDVTGTWAKDTAVGLVFEVFAVGKAASPAAPGAWGATSTTQTTNSTNLLGTNNNQTVMTGLFGWAGAPIVTSPARLAMLMRSTEEERLRCYRHYFVVNSPNVVALGQAANTTQASFLLTLPVPMRVAPISFSVSAASDWNLLKADLTSLVGTAFLGGFGTAELNLAQLVFNCVSGLVGGNATGLLQANSNGRIYIDGRFADV
ncbi:hypothetical protein [uncultured Bradyrhizobium sp.]|uniref:hypothetical protein n=1 Tax=uncultured Bradyrhizobium sp. TaxID=199684 RepID=UPI0035CAFC67